MVFTCGAIGDDDNDLLLALLTGAIVAAVGAPIDRETVLLFVVVVAIRCCCFGVVVTLAAVVVGFVGFVVCCGGCNDDDTADVGGGVADDNNIGGFTVFGMPHIFDSVVLTTLRLGLLGLHIFALSSADIAVVLSELLPLPAAAAGLVDDDAVGGNCCPNTWVLLQIAKTSIPNRNENTVKIKVV
jgi:hypothetical protein